jgi:hypothetical protein
VGWWEKESKQKNGTYAKNNKAKKRHAKKAYEEGRDGGDGGRERESERK